MTDRLVIEHGKVVTLSLDAPNPAQNPTCHPALLSWSKAKLVSSPTYRLAEFRQSAHSQNTGEYSFLCTDQADSGKCLAYIDGSNQVPIDRDAWVTTDNTDTVGPELVPFPLGASRLSRERRPPVAGMLHLILIFLQVVQKVLITTEIGANKDSVTAFMSASVQMRVRAWL
ncbi:unnamed protein product [Protopolystoma xenopodis]|uniref:Uncharacterized protein n=1 Tax=Protopolystoma xenopodis TaxID=117903 RepID=A0A448WHL8_9PLAT|nr:unnamed protein product [Protopolystoma xenopodis]